MSRDGALCDARALLERVPEAHRVGIATVRYVDEVRLYDLPGGAMRLKQVAHGIPYTIVNGETLLEDGERTGALPGQTARNAWSEARRNGAAG